MYDYPNQEQTALMEILSVGDDILICSYFDALNYCDTCPECDGGEYIKNGFFSEEDCRNGKARMDDDGTSYCSPRCEVAVEVMKPYELQKSPWEGRSVTYHKDTQYEYAVEYTYIENFVRTARFNKDTDLCKQGDHKEWVWPPYNPRVGSPEGVVDNAAFGGLAGETRPDGVVAPGGAIVPATSDYVRGDIIRVAKNVSQKQDIIQVGKSRFHHGSPGDPQANSATNYELIPRHKANQRTARASFHIDINVGGRSWENDCAGFGQDGQGGGSVWV